MTFRHLTKAVSFTWIIDPQNPNAAIDHRTGERLCDQLTNCRVFVDSNTIKVTGNRHMAQENFTQFDESEFVIDRLAGVAQSKHDITVIEPGRFEKGVAAGSYKCERRNPEDGRV